MIEEYGVPSRCRVVLHWFSGSKAEADAAIRLGCYFSVNHQMVTSGKGARMVAYLPLDRILTETDGPFGQVKGRPARPSDVALVTVALSHLRNVSVSELRRSLFENLGRLEKW